MVRTNTGEALSREAAAMRSVAREVGLLQDMGLADLRVKHLQVCGEEPRSKNLPYLRKRIAFRFQEQMEGGLSPSAKDRLQEISSLDLNPTTPAPQPRISRVTAPRTAEPRLATATRDPRLPAVGTILTREFKGFAHEVEVQENAFGYRGRTYRSLSAIAKEITGTPWNGFLFFGLMGRGGK